MTMKMKFKTGVIWALFFIISMYLAGKWAVTNYGFDTDLLWHLKIGEDILSSKQIFLDNTYSWLKGTLWTQQEWLFDVILYTVVSIGGIVGFYMLHLIPQFTFIGLSIKKNNYHFDILAPIMFLLIYWFLPFNQVNRPAEFSTYFFVLMVWMYDKEYNLKPLIYFLCGMFIANFHCGATVALLVLMIMLFVSDILLNIIFLKTNHEPWSLSRKFVIQYILSCLFFVGGLFINPYGYKQVRDMFQVMHLNSTQYINEWRCFGSSDYISWILIIGIAYVIGYGLHKHKWDKTETMHIIVLSAFLVLSLTSLKAFIMFFYLFIMYGYKYVDEMLYDFLQKTNIKPEINIKKIHISWPKPLTGKRIIYPATMILSMIFAVTVASFNQKSMNDLIDSKRDEFASEETIEFLKEIESNSDDFRLLNGYVTGNYLLYYDVECFIDSRQLPYAKEFKWSSAVDDYFDTDSHDTEAMDEFFDKYKFNYVLSNNEYNVNWYLQQKGATWSLVYSDDSNYIWKRMG